MADYQVLFEGIVIRPNGKGGTTLKVDGETVYAKDLPDFFKEAMPSSVYHEYYSLEFPEKKKLLFKEALKYSQAHPVETSSELSGEMETSLELCNLVPVIRMSSKGEWFVYDTEKQKPSSRTFQSIIAGLVTKPAIAAYKLRRAFGNTVFDPLSLEKVYPDPDNEGALLFNMYRPPAWRFLKAHEEPTDFIKFFEYLIPDPICRDYTRRWVRNLLIDINYTYLVFLGGKNLGKSAIITLFSHLVGEEYTQPLPRNWLDTHFNDFLRDKRMVYAEECVMNEANHEPMKAFIEGKQAITKKRQDTEAGIPLHASFIITNNKYKNCWAEWDDRRFSYVDLAPEIYKDSKEDLKALVGAFLDKCNPQHADYDIQELSNIGHWFLEADELDKWEDYKGKTFWEVVRTSLHSWQRAIHDCIVEGHPVYDKMALKAKWDNPKKYDWPSDMAVKDFLKDYKINGHSVGKVKKGTIYVNEPHWKTVEDDEEIL